jgi:hypothetical protein
VVNDDLFPTALDSDCRFTSVIERAGSLHRNRARAETSFTSTKRRVGWAGEDDFLDDALARQVVGLGLGLDLVLDQGDADQGLLF